MNRLFISGSESGLKLSRTLVTVLLTVLLLGALDLLLEPVATAAFKIPATLLLSPQNIPGAKALWTLREANVQPVVFTGSSQMQTAFSPHLFNQQIQSQYGMSMTSVNASFVGASPVMTLSILRSLILPARPTLVVIGVEMRAFNRQALTLVKQLNETPLGHALTLPPGPEQSLLIWLGRHSTLFQFRSDIQNWLKGLPSFSDGETIDDLGFTVVKSPDNRKLDIILGQFLPYIPDNTIQQAFGEIADLCIQASVPCVIANMPIHELAYKYIMPDAEQAYMDMLKSFVASHKLMLWDFDTAACRSVLGEESFLDLNHLNKTGAQKFTKWAAALYGHHILGKPLDESAGASCVEVIHP